jgi:CDP-diacylglycerol--serine O-phosphatidyltransferase
LGAELDSLADFLNFGVAPAMLLYQRDLVALGWAGWLVAAVYAAAAGLRLAKFNILSRTPYSGSGKRNFRGLPSTAAATGVLAAIAAVRLGTASGFEPLALAVTSLFLAALMLSNLNVPALTTLLRIERQGT